MKNLTLNSNVSYHLQRAKVYLNNYNKATTSKNSWQQQQHQQVGELVPCQNGYEHNNMMWTCRELVHSGKIITLQLQGFPTMAFFFEQYLLKREKSLGIELEVQKSLVKKIYGIILKKW